jgi:Polyketide cyclase / dehydrase and lipid transport
MPQFVHSVRVPLRPELAFALYTDASRLTDWFPRAVRVEGLTAPMSQAGSRYTIRFRGVPDAVEEVLKVISGKLQRRRFVQTQAGIGAWGDARIAFRGVDGETEITETVEYGFLPAWLAPVLQAVSDRRARQAMRQELESFKAFAECEATSFNRNRQIRDTNAPAAS